MSEATTTPGAWVSPLEERWREVLDTVARRQGYPGSRDVKELGAALERLSAWYNGLSPTVPPRAALAARLSFSFARDVPKGAAAVAGLVPGLRGRAGLRVLDLGAGLGAMSWGVVRALAAAGHQGKVVATLVDRDAQALALGAQIAAEARGEGDVELAVSTVVGDVGRPPRQEAELVLVGQALSEMDPGMKPAERATRHADVLHALLQHNVAPDGALVVVEPALRDRTRHLHEVRSQLIARGWSVFAPCLHDQRCPMLATETDWCHEDRPVDLPPWLVPVARAAGLRFQGLTFSYLVIRRDRQGLRGLVPAGTLRVVGVPRRTKGKREAELCGEPGDRLQVAMRLDREASEANAHWEDIERGDLLTFSPALPPERPRIGPATTVERREDGEHR
jgi:SAM-dependent methyltransferase